MTSVSINSDRGARTAPASQRRSSVLSLRSLRYLVLTVITVVFWRLGLRAFMKRALG